MKRYTIENAIQDVAATLDGGNDRSATTIRCCINDALDNASKSGLEVTDDEDGFGYDQPQAVALVREKIGRVT